MPETVEEMVRRQARDQQILLNEIRDRNSIFTRGQMEGSGSKEWMSKNPGDAFIEIVELLIVHHKSLKKLIMTSNDRLTTLRELNQTIHLMGQKSDTQSHELEKMKIRLKKSESQSTVVMKLEGRLKKSEERISELEATLKDHAKYHSQDKRQISGLDKRLDIMYREFDNTLDEMYDDIERLKAGSRFLKDPSRTSPTNSVASDSSLQSPRASSKKHKRTKKTKKGR